MAKPAIYNIQVTRGDTLTLSALFQDDQEPASPIDFTGCSIVMQVRQGPNYPVFAEFSSVGDNPKITFDNNDPTTGRIYIRDEAVNTAAYPWTQASYDIQVTYADGTVRTHLAGYVTVLEDITEND